MNLHPHLRADANALLDRLMEARDKESALAVIIAADFPNLPAVAGAALVILAAGTTEITDERSTP